MKMKEIASTTARMFAHLDRLSEVKKTKRIRPITIHLSPTDKCNLTCEWCSVRNRRGDEISLEDVKKIVDIYDMLGVKSIEITGGGEPTMYEELLDVIDYIHSYKLGVGLITNGLLLNEVSERALKKLTWLRISLSGVDFGLENKYFNLQTERFPDFVGCSYVYTYNTEPKHLETINDVANYLKAKYIRIVPNCYTPKDIEWGRRTIPQAITKYPNMFMQIKDYKVPSCCYWRYIKPFVNSDGFIYHCSTCALFAGRFSDPWRVTHWTEISELYEKPVTSFDNSQCTLCFYSKQNELLHDLLMDIKHPSFI